MPTLLPLSWHKRTGRFYGELSLIMVLFLSSGCAWFQKDEPATPVVAGDALRLADDIKLAQDGWPQARWWTRYGDSQLNTFVDMALRDSPSMAVANASVALAKKQTALQADSYGPVLEASASLDRQHVSSSGFLTPFAADYPKLGLTGPWYTEITLGVSGSYDFDIWGKNRASVAAALGAQNAKLAEAAQAELMIAATVTQTYYQIQTLYAMRDLLQTSQGIEAEMVRAHRARHARGMEAETDAELAQAHKVILDKQLAATESEIRQWQETFRALLGQTYTQPMFVASVPLPKAVGQLPTSLGYSLLARRPDLQALRWSVQSSLDQIEVAKAAFYPSFNLSVFFGLDALHPEDVLKAASRQYNIIPGLTLPIFDSGQLNANLQMRRAVSNLTIASYNAAIFDAVRDVGRAGIALQGLKQQVALQQGQLKALQFAAHSAQAHYQRGLVDKVFAMEARLPLLVEQGQLLMLSSQQINADIALTVALGGGYEQPLDQPGLQVDEDASVSLHLETAKKVSP